jgi:hypothetical protein
VLLGIAMLTATATGYLVKDGVREEDRIRGDVRRMSNFLASELGTLEGKSLALFATDEPTEAETRLLAELARQAQRLLAAPDQPALAGKPLPGERVADPAALLDADACVVIGSRAEAAAFLAQLEQGQYGRPVAMTRLTSGETSPDDALYFLPLSTELGEQELAARAAEKKTARYRVGWVLGVALLVTLMGITNAMLMSVTERFREIGTMKCLGATSRLVRRIFLIESLIVGVSGALAGALLGALFSLAFYCIVYGPALLVGSLDLGVLALWLLAAVLAGVFLTVVCAIYPANVASSMVPATALRSNV